MSNPFFSVILPTYNRAHFLSKAIRSVINQSYENWELIIVDDGSTDNTQRVVSEFQINDSRIKYFYQENAERSAARNNGISKAKGKWICFLDSDDYFNSTNLENWFNVVREKDGNESVFFGQLDNGKKFYNGLTGKKENIQFLFENPLVPLRVCVNRKCFELFLFDTRFRVAEDSILWMSMATKFSMSFSNHICGKYVIHDNNTVDKGYISSREMYKNLKCFFSENKLVYKSISTKRYLKYLSRIMTNISKSYFIEGRRLKAIYFLVRAIVCSPINEQSKYRLVLLKNIVFNEKVY